MRKKLTSLSLLAFLGLGTLVFAQTKGTVNDENGFPEADVEVTVKGTNKTVYTDEDGSFDIDAKVGDILIVNGNEFIVTSNNLGVLRSKKTEMVDLDETVIVAYGVQKKETIVGSNVQVKSEQFEDRAISNATKALEGAAAGVQFSTSTGQPGNGSNIRIRGFSSYSLSNAPLYVVDGSIYTGTISDINPNDIASFTILKDAASTSLYGASAANGVIMITTKKGKKGKKGQFTFSANTGVVMRGIKEYERVSAGDYYRLTWESMRNGFLESTPGSTIEQANAYASENLIRNPLNNNTGTLLNNIYNVPDNQVVVNGQLNPNAQMLYNDFDWSKYTERVGVTQQYNLGFSGATETSSFYASMGYNKEEGYLIASDYQRYTARVAGDSEVTNWLKLGVDVSSSLAKSQMAEDGASSSYSNPFYTARYMGPIYSPYLYDENGNKMYDTEGNQRYDGIFTRGRGAGAGAGRNVLQETLLNSRLRDTYSVNTRSFAIFKLAKGLTLTSNVNYDLRQYRLQYYQNKEIGDAAGTAGLAVTDQKTTSMTLNQILSYQKSFGKHNFQIDLGHESFERRVNYQYSRKIGEVMGGVHELVNFLTTTSNTGYRYDLRKESYFGRLNYDFNSKYLLSASIRQDKSSRFAPENNKGTFWSAGAGWNIHKEGFLKGSRIVNNLKLRASYGEVGNDGGIEEDPGYNADLNLYTLNRNNALETGILLSQIGNPLLTWEANKQFDLAIEFGLFNNRINGSVEYYQRRTDRMIFPVPTPGSAGVPGNSINANFGTMENKGIEVSLDFGIIRNEKLKWNLIVNASTIQNEMIKMPDGQEQIINGTKRIAKGRSIYDFWLRKWYGVDPSDGRTLYYQDPLAEDNTNTTRVINGQKFTTDHQKAEYGYAGSSIPDLYGSFSNNVSYKGFYLNTLFAYQIGGKTYDGNYSNFITTAPDGTAVHVDMLNAWKNPGDITNIPKMTTNNEAQNLASSSRFLVDSDYLSLRNATFGYTFNKEQIEGLGLSSLKLFITGENLVSWTAKQGMEPVQSFNGTTSYRYTPSKIWSVGVNVQF